MTTIDAVLGTEQRISEIVGSLDSIATLPEVVARINEVIHDPRSTAVQLHRILSHDPALVSRLLKLVNSSFYARAHEITSVERAIVMLGFETVHHLAIAATMGQLFKNIKLCDGFSARDVWTHSVGVAVVARQIGKLSAPEMAEEAFLAGLVHDVGILVELQVCPDKLRTVCERAMVQRGRFSAIELDVIGVDHQELGAALAEKWGFPPGCRAVARHHHHPALAEEPWKMITAIVHAADTLCCQECVGFDLTAAHQLADETAFQGLVPLEAIEGAKEAMDELVHEAIRVFVTQ